MEMLQTEKPRLRLVCVWGFAAPARRMTRLRPDLQGNNCPNALGRATAEELLPSYFQLWHCSSWSYLGTRCLVCLAAIHRSLIHLEYGPLRLSAHPCSIISITPVHHRGLRCSVGSLKACLMRPDSSASKTRSWTSLLTGSSLTANIARRWQSQQQGTSSSPCKQTTISPSSNADGRLQDKFQSVRKRILTHPLQSHSHRYPHLLPAATLQDHP